MDLDNIKRNQLDYILTDVLPTELSEMFSFRFFYDYLMSHNKELKIITEKLIKQKNKNHETLFNDSGNWTSMPLKYTIMKGLHSEREISLLQPLAAMELFLFVNTYQKELTTILEKNAIFSIRYHKRNVDVFYKAKNKSVIKYFVDISDEIGKEVIEQTGMFFKIGPFQSISAFTSSERWMVLNSKYKFFIRSDYKACFDSIYTHAFNWIIGKDVNDTKDFNNASIYSSIDRILMNVNARTSNGIVVGPEYSRMVAEILLQTIDREVYNQLLNKGYAMGENYDIYRFVDDIFIFSESESLANLIIDTYSGVSRKYLLMLNEGKFYKSKVPFVLESWLNETNLFVNRACQLLFLSYQEREAYVEGYIKKHAIDIEKSVSIKPYLVNGRSLNTSKKKIMGQFNELICHNESKDKTIVAYFLGAILNHVARNKDGVTIFRMNVTENTVFSFIDLVFYVYSFFPNYNNTQRFISIISYVQDEYDLVGNVHFQILVDRYAFIFDKANLNDVINLVLLCTHLQVEIPYRQESGIVNRLVKDENPILWATYLLYSRYNEAYRTEILQMISSELNDKLDAIVREDRIYTYKEFWWIIIFNKCPYILQSDQNVIDNLINKLKVIAISDNIGPGALAGNLFVEYLKTNPKQFFEWNISNKDLLRKITFKTRERSVFKNYHENIEALYWSSL